MTEHKCLGTVGELRAALAGFEDHATLLAMTTEEGSDLYCVLNVSGLVNGSTREPLPADHPQYAVELLIG